MTSGSIKIETIPLPEVVSIEIPTNLLQEFGRDIRPSRASLLFDIAQSSMPYETFCMMKHLPARRT